MKMGKVSIGQQQILFCIYYLNSLYSTVLAAWPLTINILVEEGYLFWNNTTLIKKCAYQIVDALMMQVKENLIYYLLLFVGYY